MNALRIHSNEVRKNLHRLALALIVGIVAFAAADAYAVSKAGALFLRVPVGSRAAGMGQAYVAVADDATATHWNPAGLGAAPMSAIWSEVTIPHRYRPVEKFAVVKRGGGGDGFDGYEVWLLGAEGLVMYNGSKWRSGKVYEASPDEDIETIVKRYLQSSDDDEVAEAMARVALVNNARTLEYIDAFEQKTLSALGENEEWIADISNRFLTLKKSYNICMVYWPRFWEVEKRFKDDSRKSKFGEREFDRLSVGLERSVRRHLPEEIILPFTLSFDGELTALETSEKFVWVGTTEGLHRYDGNRWISFHAAVESAKESAGDESAGAAKPNTPVVGMTIPSNNIRFLTVDNKRLFIGTDKGLVEHFGIGWEIVGANAGLPQGKASGVTFETVDRGWAVVDDDVYHLSGGVWRNYTELT
ncbi:MAG: hypothetical protein IH914_09585, partial [candidate division Zixibacteria bacterium]|nr:hypothetical protein [candidate division Zixibacteria bacterium]